MSHKSAPSTSELQDSNFLLQLVYPAMERMGLDIGLICERCRITPQLLQDRQARFPHAAQAKFWDVLEELSGDPLVGLHLVELMDVYKGQVLEYLFLSSRNLGEGLRRALNYQRLVTDALQVELCDDGELASLQMRFTDVDAPSLRHRNESFALFIIRYFREMTAGVFAPARIEFPHLPVAPPEKYAEFFDCELRFEQPVTAIYFPRDILETPSRHAEPELLKLHEQVASAQLAQLQKHDVVADVRQVIAEILEQGQPELESVAERLNITARALRSQLAEVDTSFNKVLTDYRCVLAKRLLANTRESINEVVYLTGFSEPSTFYRAFKRWTDMTPVQYREYKQGRQAEPAPTDDSGA